MLDKFGNFQLPFKCPLQEVMTMIDKFGNSPPPV